MCVLVETEDFEKEVGVCILTNSSTSLFGFAITNQGGWGRGQWKNKEKTLVYYCYANILLCVFTM